MSLITLNFFLQNFLRTYMLTGVNCGGFEYEKENCEYMFNINFDVDAGKRYFCWCIF